MARRGVSRVVVVVACGRPDVGGSERVGAARCVAGLVSTNNSGSAYAVSAHVNSLPNSVNEKLAVEEYTVTTSVVARVMPMLKTSEELAVSTMS